MLKYKCEERITWANVYLHPLFKEEDNPMKNNINLGALSASKIKMNDNLLFY